jgi:hypothetical protein
MEIRQKCVFGATLCKAFNLDVTPATMLRRLGDREAAPTRALMEHE